MQIYTNALTSRNNNLMMKINASPFILGGVISRDAKRNNDRRVNRPKTDRERERERERERGRGRERERQREIGVKVRDCYWMSVRHARSIDGDYFLYIQQVYDWSGSGWILSSKRSVEGHTGEYLGSAHL